VTGLFSGDRGISRAGDGTEIVVVACAGDYEIGVNGPHVFSRVPTEIGPTEWRETDDHLMAKIAAQAAEISMLRANLAALVGK
jgi:hypothetical protein